MPFRRSDMPYERLAYWFCVVALAAMGGIYSVGLASMLAEGQINSFGKGSHRVIVWATAPYAFISALIPHLMLNGFFWYGAYWVWFSYIRKEDR
ncbi:hypothetical protein [Roseateles sp. LYH14W]|uniref:Uncharacterized protein n=1 Tax=Pelomonas parva TaxID=3299032 RepID=A0ABW7F804_9BURK